MFKEDSHFQIVFQIILNIKPALRRRQPCRTLCLDERNDNMKSNYLSRTVPTTTTTQFSLAPLRTSMNLFSSSKLDRSVTSYAMMAAEAPLEYTDDSDAKRSCPAVSCSQIHLEGNGIVEAITNTNPYREVGTLPRFHHKRSTKRGLLKCISAHCPTLDCRRPTALPSLNTPSVNLAIRHVLPAPLGPTRITLNVLQSTHTHACTNPAVYA